MIGWLTTINVDMNNDFNGVYASVSALSDTIKKAGQIGADAQKYYPEAYADAERTARAYVSNKSITCAATHGGPGP